MSSWRVRIKSPRFPFEDSCREKKIESESAHADMAHRDELKSFLKKAASRSESDLKKLGCHAAGKLGKDEQSVAQLRAARKSRADDLAFSQATLRIVDGMLRWSLDEEIDSFNLPGAKTTMRAGMRRGLETSGEVVDSFKLEELKPNQITSFLTGVDDFLTPNKGLFRVDKETLKIGGSFTANKAQRFLLLIHGTFSNAENMVNGFINESGKAFLKSAANHYDEFLAFGHPTLSVSPMLNALDLARFLRGCDADIDIVCHSRGGLVARWWAECFDEIPSRKRKIVFVGSPLAGTSLAAPDRIKDVIDVMSNIATAIGTTAGVGATLVPFATPLLTACKAMMRLVSLLSSTVSKTPLIDAGMSLVPGLAGQSAVGNNEELIRLREFVIDAPRLQQYFFVSSNFETEAIGWQFWKALRKPLLRLADAGTNQLFKGPNDLVVDTNSMTSLSQKLTIEKSRIKDFGKNDQVHHLNYFDFPETNKFVADSLLK